ncbi:hypothetical protein BN12_40037 [Nostocoides japonicum T1-X7]|uniref:Uncharacterized protein n=1 Tax=Nostocoides japonicum T1-X7 TaxID=1194083 RepID=A0A077M1X4_9MICO|nr:hypothetical protein BN12_40037 [Tetrasphaera japonica T1-X7]
MALLVTLLMLD